MGALKVEVVYALAGGCEAVAVALPTGATVRDAVVASGLARRHPEIDLEHPRLGVFGRECAPDSPVADGSRVEIYRPLQVDPKEARRQRARRVSRRTSR